MREGEARAKPGNQLVPYKCISCFRTDIRSSLLPLHIMSNTSGNESAVHALFLCGSGTSTALLSDSEHFPR